MSWDFFAFLWITAKELERLAKKEQEQNERRGNQNTSQAENKLEKRSRHKSLQVKKSGEK